LYYPKVAQDLSILLKIQFNVQSVSRADCFLSAVNARMIQLKIKRLDEVSASSSPIVRYDVARQLWGSSQLGFSILQVESSTPPAELARHPKTLRTLHLR
jgi:hypothetical protein